MPDIRSQLDQTIRSIRTRDWMFIEYECGDVELYPTGSESQVNPTLKKDVIRDLRRTMDDAGVALQRSQNSQVEAPESVQKRLAELGYI